MPPLQRNPPADVRALDQASPAPFGVTSCRVSLPISLKTCCMWLRSSRRSRPSAQPLPLRVQAIQATATAAAATATDASTTGLLSPLRTSPSGRTMPLEAAAVTSPASEAGVALSRAAADMSHAFVRKGLRSNKLQSAPRGPTWEQMMFQSTWPTNGTLQMPIYQLMVAAGRRRAPQGIVWIHMHQAHCNCNLPPLA